MTSWPPPPAPSSGYLARSASASPVFFALAFAASLPGVVLAFIVPRE